MTKLTADTKQAAIDKGWALFNRAMEALEDLSEHLDVLEGMEVDVEIPRTAAGNASTQLENVYSYGPPILPPHSSEAED